MDEDYIKLIVYVTEDGLDTIKDADFRGIIGGYIVSDKPHILDSQESLYEVYLYL